MEKANIFIAQKFLKVFIEKFSEFLISNGKYGWETRL
jgi:hypothetical protein